MTSINFRNITEEVEYKRKRITRILVDTKDKLTHLGTGFFISNTDILTNSHMVFGMGLKKLETFPDFHKTNQDEDKIIKYYKLITTRSAIELVDKTKKAVFLKHIDTKYDIAILRLSNGHSYDNYFELNIKNDINYGDDMQFCGYQTAPYIEPINWPFTYNTGKISAFPNTYIEGERYPHLQINSINLGGNSGAPLFKKLERKPIGIINGNQKWGNDNMAFVKDDGNIQKDSFRVPLSIAYASSFKTLISKSSIFKTYTDKLIKSYKD